MICKIKIHQWMFVWILKSWIIKLWQFTILWTTTSLKITLAPFRHKRPHSSVTGSLTHILCWRRWKSVEHISVPFISSFLMVCNFFFLTITCHLSHIKPKWLFIINIRPQRILTPAHATHDKLMSPKTPPSTAAAHQPEKYFDCNVNYWGKKEARSSKLKF